MNPNKSRAFTLIELLVAVGLMALIMTIVALIFQHTMKAVNHSVGRMTIYLNARTSLDHVEVDLLGCLPLENTLQGFSLEEGKYLDMSGNESATTSTGGIELDKINLRTFTSVGGKFQGIDLTYLLGKERDPTILAETGGTGKTLKTKRQLYALYRIPRTINKDGTVGPIIDDPQLDPEERESAMALCHYVLSFNIEYFDTTMKQFRQISDHKTDPPHSRDLFEWPIGDANPPEEQLHRGIRITVKVIADASESEERVFPRVIWIPVGY